MNQDPNQPPAGGPAPGGQPGPPPAGPAGVPLSYGPSTTPPAPPPPPPPPQVIHITAKPGGFFRALTLVIGLLTFGTVFLIGLVLGVGIMLATPSRSSVVLSQEYRDGGSDTVAVIPVSGVIDARQAEFVRAAVDKVLDMSTVRAVVLRVDSPGGGVTPSDQIWYQVGRLKKRKIPVVASYGGIAASGGYYISCHADSIMAEETCVTGSIGVMAQILTMEDLMGKVGVEPVTLVASGSPRKDVANDIFRTWNEQDREKIVTVLDAAYETFVNRVHTGRGTLIGDAEAVRALADGSIFTAGEALANGLIDAVGYLDDAIMEAERRGNVKPGRATVTVLREPPSIFGTPPTLMQGARPDPRSPLSADALRSLVTDLGSPRLMFLIH
ncbi:MAG: signal peptide peptidase SppA [Planctomycetota bacterium]|jgi:protease-4